MLAEIVTTGTELLLGQIDDTNATYLARQLRDLGIDIYYRTTVGDNEHRIALVLERALERADVVIVTGGLGPTVDDVTREAVARATGRSLILHPYLLSQIEAFFARIGSTMSDNNRRQAYLPEGCLPIENPVGTAPAFIVEMDSGSIITLPGVPREMRYLMERSVVPYLKERMGIQEVLVTRVLRTVAVGESRVDAVISDLETSANPTVGLSAHPGQTDVRIVAKAPTYEEAEALLAPFEAKIRQRLGAAIYATGNATLEAVVADQLRLSDASLSVAETVTQGELARRMSAHQGTFRGGIVGADWPAVSEPFPSLRAVSRGLDPADWVCEQVAVKLANAVRQTWDSTYGLAVLGDGQNRPWVAIAWDGGVETRRLRFMGDDERGRSWTVTLALEFLRRLLLGLASGWARERSH